MIVDGLTSLDLTIGGKTSFETALASDVAVDLVTVEVDRAPTLKPVAGEASEFTAPLNTRPSGQQCASEIGTSVRGLHTSNDGPLKSLLLAKATAFTISLNNRRRLADQSPNSTNNHILSPLQI